MHIRAKSLILRDLRLDGIRELESPEKLGKGEFESVGDRLENS